MMVVRQRLSIQPVGFHVEIGFMYIILLRVGSRHIMDSFDITDLFD